MSSTPSPAQADGMLAEKKTENKKVRKGVRPKKKAVGAKADGGSATDALDAMPGPGGSAPKSEAAVAASSAAVESEKERHLSAARAVVKAKQKRQSEEVQGVC